MIGAVGGASGGGARTRAGVSVTAGGGGATWRGNEPAGMTTLVDTDFSGSQIPTGADVLFGDGTNLGVIGNTAGTVRKVTNQDGPYSSPNAMEREYPPGMSGTGIGDVYHIGMGAGNTAYCCVWVKHNADFEWNTISQKLIFFFETDGGFTLLQTMYASTFLSLFRAGTPYNANQATTPDLNGGEWELVEFLADRDSGTAGEAWVWQNGVLVNNHEIAMPSAFAEFKWDSTWGGGGDKQTTDLQWTDQLYLSVK